MDISEIAELLIKTYAPGGVNSIQCNYKRAMGQYLSESIVPSDIVVLSGRGATLQTTRGELIDLASMTFNCILGQNDPWVNANMVAYLLSGRPSFLTTRLGSEFYYKVAGRIIAITRMKNAVINHRQSNGTDATELAVLAAYRHLTRGQSTLVAFKNSYHGQGLTSYHMSDIQKKHRFLIHDSPVVFLPQPTNTSSIDANDALSDRDVRTFITLERISQKVFAVIIEPIQVNGGVNTPTRAFMRALKTLCGQKHIALIYDEVQTGFGWLGTMTAAERYGVYPNLLVLSKALTAGNGPLSALVSDSIYKDIPDGTGAKTNGADVRSLVASNAVMDRLVGLPKSAIPRGLPAKLAKELETGLLSEFENKRQLLQRHLEHLQEFSKGIIRELKGDGLIRGADIVNAKGRYDENKAHEIHNELLHNGVLVRYRKHTLLFKPPIVTTEDEMERGFEKIKKIFKKHT